MEMNNKQRLEYAKSRIKEMLESGDITKEEYAKMLHVFVLFYSEHKAPLYRYVLDNNAQKSDIYTDERKVK